MNKIYTSKIFIISFSVFSLLALMSSSSGRGNVFGQAVSGAPGDSNMTCASSGCHSSGAFSPMPILSIFDEDGNEITDYTPGETYDVKLSIETTGSPSRFGFQMVSIAADLSPVNQWENIGSNMQLVTLGDRDYIEHNSPSSSNEFLTQWTAPASGTGDINFFYAVNAVNNNGSPSGDGGANDFFTLTETLSSASDLEDISVNLFPNPTTEYVIIEGLENSFKYQISDRNGRRIINGIGQGKSALSTLVLDPGLYFINIESNDQYLTKKLIIQ